MTTCCNRTTRALPLVLLLAALALAACGEKAEPPRPVAASVPAKAAAPTPAPEALRSYEQGLAFARGGRLQEALGALAAATKAHPSDATWRTDFGSLLLRGGAHAAAVREFEAATNLDPQLAPAWMGLGQAWFFQDEGEKAERCFLEVTKLTPGDAAAHDWLGGARLLQAETHLGARHFDHDRLGAAVTALQEAVRLDDTRAAAHLRLGRAFSISRDFEGAAHELRRAAELAPQWAEPQWRLGDSLHEQGRMQEAGQAFGEAVRLAPEGVEGHAGLGRVLLDRSEFDAAIASLRTAVKLDPMNSKVLYTLSTALARAERPAEAAEAQAAFLEAQTLEEELALAEQALRRGDAGTELLLRVAKLRGRAGKRQGAAEALRRVLEIDPTNAEAQAGFAALAAPPAAGP